MDSLFQRSQGLLQITKIIQNYFQNNFEQHMWEQNK